MEQRSSETRRLKSLVLIMDYPCTWLRLSRRREAFACGDARNWGVRQASRMKQACWHRNVITLAGWMGPRVHGKRAGHYRRVCAHVLRRLSEGRARRLA